MSHPGRNNAHIPLIVVLLIGAALLVALAGSIWLLVLGRTLDSVMVLSNIASGCIGALVGVLAKTDRDHDGKPAAVTIENLPGDPVPVTQED